MGRRAPPRGGGCCARVAFRLIFCQDPGSRSTRSSESRTLPPRAQLPSTLSSDDDNRGQRRTPSPQSEDASVNSGDWQDRTGRIPRTMIRPYNELEPESKRAFERAFEELGHRANMKTGGITAFDKRDFGLDLRFTHRSTEFFDSQSNVQLQVLDAFIDYSGPMTLSEMPSTGKYRKPSSAHPTCIAIPGMWMPETVAAGEGAPEGNAFDEERRDAMPQTTSRLLGSTGRSWPRQSTGGSKNAVSTQQYGRLLTSRQ